MQTGEVIICEGYTDVIGFFTAGLPRAVATCGTALTEEHFRLLGRFAKRVVLAFDADAAGQSAAARFYQWEKRHELEVARRGTPQGSDPADLAMKEPQALQHAVENARTFLSFRVERALSSTELKTGEDGHGQQRRHSPWSPSTRMSSSVISSSSPSRTGQGSIPSASDRCSKPSVRAFKTSGTKLSEPAKSGPGGRSTSSDEPRLPGSRTTTEDSISHLRPAGPAEMAPTRQNGLPRSPPGARAGRDALVLAVREPQAMAGRLHEVLFADPLPRPR